MVPAAAHMPSKFLSEATTPCFKSSGKMETMRVRRLDHVLLAMPAGRELEARNFYSGILGIPETKKPAELAGRGGCWFEDGELKVHLGVEKYPGAQGAPGLHRGRPCGIDRCPDPCWMSDLA